MRTLSQIIEKHMQVRFQNGSLDVPMLQFRRPDFAMDLLREHRILFRKLPAMRGDPRDGTIPEPLVRAAQQRYEEILAKICGQTCSESVSNPEIGRKYCEFVRHRTFASCWFAASHPEPHMWKDFGQVALESRFPKVREYLASEVHKGSMVMSSGCVFYVPDYFDATSIDAVHEGLFAFLKQQKFHSQKEIRFSVFIQERPFLPIMSDLEIGSDQVIGDETHFLPSEFIEFRFDPGKALVRVHLGPDLAEEDESRIRATAEQSGLPVFRSGEPVRG
jgi:hypothetical protein